MRNNHGITFYSQSKWLNRINGIHVKNEPLVIFFFFKPWNREIKQHCDLYSLNIQNRNTYCSIFYSPSNMFLRHCTFFGLALNPGSDPCSVLPPMAALLPSTSKGAVVPQLGSLTKKHLPLQLHCMFIKLTRKIYFFMVLFRYLAPLYTPMRSIIVNLGKGVVVPQPGSLTKMHLLPQLRCIII